jgi:hypothetical protein
MADRTDIDALLISALYGELTPADEARLTAHLESHPADRTALADLTRTRDAIRESRVFAGQLEPPQSVSARLLQEAARLSPRPSARETEGWFFRLSRAFMAHPALAVAAMLVLTVSVAGTLYVRHGDRLAEMTRPSAPAMQASSAPAAPAAEPPAPAPRAMPAPRGQGSGSYRVALDEVSKERATEKQQEAPRQDTDKGYKDTLGNESDGFAPTKSAKPMRKSPSKSGIEVRSREPAPKDFDDSEVARGETNDKKKDVADRIASSGAPAPAPNAVVATPPAVTGGKAAAADNAPAQPPAKPSALASADPGRRDGASNQSLVAWVRKQHDLVVSLVKSSNCRDAANAALEIYSRAPAYYDANVTTDRAVKPCLAYLNNERDREERKVAAKRAMSNDALRAAPADVQAAPPATKK